MNHPRSAPLSSLLAAVAVVVILMGAATAQTETLLHTFTGGSDGGTPFGQLIPDGSGNLYGTTASGGSGAFCACGTVFELSQGTQGTWTETVLYSFGSESSSADGAVPYSSLTFDGSGNLYGTTLSGGTSFAGVVYQLKPNGNGVWTENVIFNFPGGSEGGSPVGEGVLLDSAGNIYGVAGGGTNQYGLVYELVLGTSGTYSESVLYTFKGLDDGGVPNGSPLIADAAGNLYGVASAGGLHDYGVVYRLSRGSSGAWTERVLYSFPGGAGGSFPSGNLLLDKAGDIYGLAGYIAFELVAEAGGGFTVKTLHSFLGGSDGASPHAGFVADNSGNLYSTTNVGGLHRGTVFELSPTTSGTWTEKILHRFGVTSADGVLPTYGAVGLGANGSIYGATSSGGAFNAGVAYRITP